MPTGVSPPTPGATATPFAEPIALARGVAASTALDVGSDGRDFLVAYSASSGEAGGDDASAAAAPTQQVLGVRVSGQGSGLDDRPILLSAMPDATHIEPDRAAYDAPSIGFDGTSYWVAFHGRDAGDLFFPRSVVAVVRLSTGGELGGAATELSRGDSLGGGCATGVSAPALAGIPGGAVLLFPVGGFCRGPAPFGGAQVTGLRLTISVAGTTTADPFSLLPPNPPLPEHPIWRTGIPAVASAGEIAFGAWGEASPAQPEAFVGGALIAPDLDAEVVRLGPTARDFPTTVVASDGADFLVVWSPSSSETGDSGSQIRAARYRPGKGALDADGGFLVAEAAESVRLGGAAYGGSAYLVTWSGSGGVRGAWIRPDGSVTAPFAVTTSSADVASDVASNGERFLISFVRRDAGGAFDLLAGLLSPPG